MSNIPENRNALPIGYHLENYQIQSILGDGGFGITYLAQDIQLDTKVALKEYLPSELAVRDGDNYTVHAKSQKDDENFAWGLDRFMKEAQTLAQFKHPNIIRVWRFFSALNTAYIVMEYEPGQNLANFLKEGDTTTAEELMKFLPALLGGLETVHKAGYLHRDIKPANIYLREHDDSPLLIDFGSARYDLGTRSRNITTIVTPGYAPFEQYQSEGSQQGPWTDIYSLAAVLYRLISGKVPTESTERVAALIRSQSDPLTPATNVGRGQYDQPFLEGIDWALKVNEQDRPQDIEAWRKQLCAKPLPEELLPIQANETSNPPPVVHHSGWLRGFMVGVIVVILFAIFVVGGLLFYQEREARLQAEAGVTSQKSYRGHEFTPTKVAETDREPQITEATTEQPESAKQKPTQPAQPESETVEPAKPQPQETEPVPVPSEQETVLRTEASERAAIAQAQLPSGQLRMMTGAGVRLRQQPRRNAKKGVILQIGLIVSQLESSQQTGEDWYQIKTPNNDIGWVYGEYTMPLEPDKRAQAYLEVAKNKLNSQASFGDLVDLCNFLNRASNEVELDKAVELKWLYLQALQRSLEYISPAQQEQPRYSEWLTQHKTNIVYQEQEKRWFVKNSLYQQLQAQYRFLPIAEHILPATP